MRFWVWISVTSLENQERLFLVDSDLLPYFRATHKIPLQSYGEVKQISSRSTDHYFLAIFAGIALKPSILGTYSRKKKKERKENEREKKGTI